MTMQARNYTAADVATKRGFVGSYRIKKFTPEQIAQAMELRESGLFWHEIAHRLNCSATILQSCVKRAEQYGFEAWV